MIELTQDYLGGKAKAGDCGDVTGTNSDGSMTVSLKLRNCMPMKEPLIVILVSPKHVKECRCDTATYGVRSGDSLGRIAEFHKVGVKDLMALNPQLANEEAVAPGMTINVPNVGEQGPSIHAALAGGAGPKWRQIAMRELETGVDEIAGPAQHNPRIVEYHQSTTLKATSDEVPWCSSFVNWCMMKAGVERTHSAAARSWLKWGVTLDEPRKGCVVVFSRPPDPASGHVAFFEKDMGERIRVLGGNQGNQVSITTYPKTRLLGYRWPAGVE